MNTQLHFMFQEAFRAFQMGDLIKAEGVLKRLLHLIPNNFDVVHLLAIVCAGQGKHLEALSHYKKAIKLNPSDSLALSNFGSSLNVLGRNQEALVVFQKALKINPKSFECWFNSGNVLCSMSRYDDALPYYEQAVKLNPEYFPAHINYGKALFHLKRYSESLNSYDSALNLRADYAEAYSSKGNALNELQRFDEALIQHQLALRLDPDCAEVYCNKAVTLHNLKRFDEAIAHFDKAISLKLDYAEAYSNKGNVLNELKRFDEAIVHFDKAISLKPDYAEAYYNKGNLLNELKRFDEAIAHYDKAISLKPDYAEAYSNKGNVLHELKYFDEAIAHYDKAISLKPDYAEAYSNKGNVLHELKYFDEAIAHCGKAISLKPDYAEAYSNKGNVLHELKRFDEAIVHYDKAISLKPCIDWAYGNLIHTKMKICDWSKIIAYTENITNEILAGKRVTTPFPLVALVDDALLQKKSSEIYIQDKYPSNSALGPIHKYSKKEKIKIGYFSADFHNHATAYLMAELFELHDKNQFEVVGFSFGPKQNDEMRRRLEESFDQFIEVGHKTDIEIAQLSRILNIDIAVDLKGFTQNAKPKIFSYRAAPIQVNYLGYPGTIGASYIDYIIADETLIPKKSQQAYSEKVVYLPNSYQVNDRKRVILDKQYTRQELGLPKNGFVFCCFNNNYKILPATFESWMRILKAVDGSVLWLLQDNPKVVENLNMEATKHGVNSNRLVFGERMSLSEHLARHFEADLFLDTFPCNAHTTTSDALWAKLPVLTLMGESFASRVAASLLNAVDLPELITTSQDEYESLAIDLATKPEKLIAIRRKLEKNRLATPLFDTPLFTKNLEAAYIKMYEKYKFNLQPDHIYIV